MKKRLPISSTGHRIIALTMLGVTALVTPTDTFAMPMPQAQANSANAVSSVRKLNPTAYEVIYSDGNMLTADFYGPNIVRLFLDPDGGIVRDPQATPPAEILTATPRKNPGNISMADSNGVITLGTGVMTLSVDKATGMITLTDLDSGREVFKQVAPFEFGDSKTTVALAEMPDEYFYGGGVQNGRFSHKGKIIDIVNTSSWVDGGVASPAPFYWSTGGYGMMWHTFAPGKYDFGATEPGKVTLTHDTPYLDVFISADATPTGLLNDFYQLTGNPVLLPKFGFYQGHLNAYNRDYWAETETGGVLFEDGKRYRESQQDNGGIKESLNGELPGNYQFSARAVVDRYANNDMPLGWVLPNDGYGAGYGQTGTLEGNVANLKSFGDYARGKGVEIGLWTQSDLYPKDGIEPLLQRDIVQEIRDAGVRVLKTDVAWVGAGYSFGLNGVADVGRIMPYYGNDARPFIISVDGWAGTQRYAGIWTGDQTGGDWEYIRFHIPTYIGSGLSGNPNISSDTDGIFGGRRPIINVRDFQWKTFTPMQLSMDGWGANAKYPHAFGEPWTSINRHYLKLKSELMPYTYTYAREAVDGKPLIRALFLDYPNDYTHSAATRYEFLYGPDMLIAPIYQATKADTLGNDIRNGIYLPEGELWVDYFDGTVYSGGRIINNYPAPVWKLPVFVRQGAIIPMNNPNNNPGQIDRHLRIYELYPSARPSKMTEYDDDGTTEQYRSGIGAITKLSMNVNDKGVMTFAIAPTVGTFDGFEPEKITELRINATAAPASVEAVIGKRKVKLTKVDSAEAFASGTNVYYYNATPNLNKFSTPGSAMASIPMTKNPQILVKLGMTDVAANGIEVTVKGYKYDMPDPLLTRHGSLSAPVLDSEATVINPYDMTPAWQPAGDADYYEIEYNGQLYSTIINGNLIFEDLTPDTEYSFRLRAVNADGVSDWTPFTLKTLPDPLRYAVKGIQGTCTAESQGGAGLRRMFDHKADADMWHSRYGVKATPCTVDMDLVSVNTLDKLEYLPRLDAGNGTITEGTICYSMDGNKWSKPVAFNWERNSDTKTFEFDGNPQARYVRMNIDKAVGGFASGREFFVFRVPGSESYLQGDINKDGKIDDNDLTSYMNYNGLRRGDGDFDYVSIGDINGNDLIDSYDISLVGTQLDGGITEPGENVGGSLSLTASTHPTAAGQELTIDLIGTELSGVNALSAAIPYDATVWEYVGIEPVMAADMYNMTYDRLHTDGSKVLYPTFVNLGTKTLLNGNGTVARIRFRAKQRATFDTKTAGNFIITDRSLHSINQD